MAKRFTDTEKWKDPWFKKLKGKNQLFWLYVLDTCDHAGVWKDQFEDFEFFSGFEMNENELGKAFSDRIVKINSESYFIPKFILFQYGKLKPESNNAHKGVINSLTYNGISYPSLGASEGLLRGYLAPQDKDKDKDMDKDKSPSYTNTALEITSKKPRPVLELSESRKKSNLQKLSDKGNIINPEWIVVEYFNALNNRDIKQIDANYRLIKTRLGEGFTVDEMKLVIEHTAKNWTNDPFWGRLNRISTIFNGKFNDYLSEAQNALKPILDVQALNDLEYENDAREFFKRKFGHYPEEVEQELLKERA